MAKHLQSRHGRSLFPLVHCSLHPPLLKVLNQRLPLLAWSVIIDHLEVSARCRGEKDWWKWMTRVSRCLFLAVVHLHRWNVIIREAGKGNGFLYLAHPVGGEGGEEVEEETVPPPAKPQPGHQSYHFLVCSVSFNALKKIIWPTNVGCHAYALLMQSLQIYCENLIVTLKYSRGREAGGERDPKRWIQGWVDASEAESERRSKNLPESLISRFESIHVFPVVQAICGWGRMSVEAAAASSSGTKCQQDYFDPIRCFFEQWLL